jgi:glutathione S-transferase
MPIDLYYSPGSPPSRAVRLAAAAIGVDLNLKYINAMAGEQLTPEFIKVTCNRIFYKMKRLGSKILEDSELKSFFYQSYKSTKTQYLRFLFLKIVNLKIYF